MTGQEFKYIIERSGMRMNALAEKLGIMPQQLNNVFHAADVKSGTLERVADIMGVPVSSFYGGGVTNNQVNNTIGGDNNVNLNGYDALKKRDEQIDRLLTIIEKMQEK